MSVLNINERSIFLFHNKRCQVLNVYLADNEIRYRQFLDNSELLAAQSILINIPSFQKCVQDGDIKLEDNRKHTVDTHLSAQDFNKIEYRFRYVDECFRQRPSAPTNEDAVKEAIRNVAHHQNDLRPPCKSTVQAWIKMYREGAKHKRALLDKDFFGRQTRRRFPLEIEEAFQDCIANYYLIAKPRSYDYIHVKFAGLCKDILQTNAGKPGFDISVPCLSTLINRIRVFTDEEALVAKYGVSQARSLIKAKLKAFRVSTILERTEMDGIHIHIGIVDKHDVTVFLGSPVVMLTIDAFSRRIIDYSIHLTKKKSEPADLINKCIKHIFDVNRDERWPVINKLLLLVTDASAAATGDKCTPVFIEYNVTLLVTTSGMPQEKPFIESFNHTFRRMFLKFLSGYIGSEKFRGDTIKLHDGVESLASMTLEGFINQLEYFIHEVYHKNPHTGLCGRAPIDVWDAEMLKMPYSYQHEAIISTGAELHGCVKEPTYSKKNFGFIVDKRWYRDKGLQKWLISSKDGVTGYPEKEVLKKVKVLYSEIDVRSITVIHPKTGEPKVIPLWNIDKLQIDEDKPLQREEYLALLERPYKGIPSANKIHFDPSESITRQSEDILKAREAAKVEIKKRKASKRTKPQHHTPGSEAFKGEVTQHIQDIAPKNVVIHKNSVSQTTSEDDFEEEWELEVNLNDIGGSYDET
jgi:hypothetical protein